MTAWFDPAGVRAALGAAVLLSGAMLGERLLVDRRVRAYFRVALPLGEEPVPIDKVPEATEGVGAAVLWHRDGDFVSWWANPARRGTPRGLHGHARLVVGPRGVRVQVAWFPPWMPLIAATWLFGIGAIRGEAPLAGSLAAVIVAGVFVVHRSFALRAAADLRFALAADTRQTKVMAPSGKK